MAGGYRTKQREAVLRCLARNSGRALTARDIHGQCARADGTVSLATVYRQLERLADEGAAKKIITDDHKSIRYQYRETAAQPDRLFLRCDGCDRILEIDCGVLTEISGHMLKEHGFRIDTARSVLYGRCRDCQ